MAYRYEYGDGHDLKHIVLVARCLHSILVNPCMRRRRVMRIRRWGIFHAYVTVTYAGQYSIDGGPWQFFGTEVSRVE